MDFWVTTLIKDIKGKVGFSGNQLTREADETLNDATLSDVSCDYFPSGLSVSELRLLIQYILKTRQTDSSNNLVNIFGKLSFMEDLASESISSEPCLELDMSKTGHACVAVPLKERSWPPDEGYSFACWFKYNNLKNSILKLFSVSSTDGENAYNEQLYLKDGVLTLDINGEYSISSSNLELEEGVWYHLSLVLGPINALVTEHPSGTVYIYIDGNLKHTGELKYAPLFIENHLLVTVGVPIISAVVSDLKWAVRSFYLFEEQISADCVRFMYIIGRGYKTLFLGDGEVVIDELDEGTTGFNLEMLENLWLELCGKKLMLAFNATRTEAFPASQSLKLLNLVDPLSFTSFSTGLPRSGHLCGDISICRRCVTGNIIHQFTGIAVVLSLVESAETKDMLYTALRLLSSTLHQNPQKFKQMKSCRGYHLLSNFLRSRIDLFDIQCLHILFKILVHENSFLNDSHNNQLPSPKSVSQVNSPDFNTTKILDELYIAEYYESTDDLPANEETFTQDSLPVNPNKAIAPSLYGLLSDGDLVEHVLLDWRIWVNSSVSIQLEILNCFETLVSVYKYKDHNLLILHERNIVQHLLAALHMEDIQVVVIEKVILLLRVILEHNFLDSEVNSVTLFLLTTFNPPEVTKPLHVIKETKTKRVTLRNLLLETLIDLQVTFMSEELLEKWHSIVSSKLISYFLDEAVHPTTMGWIITLLCLCLISSPKFALEFQTGGGYQTLVRVLSKCNDSLEIYYTLFSVVFNKPIYPKLPEVGILDLEALLASNGDSDGLKYGNILDCIVIMVKSVFDQLRLLPSPENHNAAIFGVSAEESVEGNADIIEEVEGDAVVITHGASEVQSWDSAANVASLLRFMANLAKMGLSFSGICARPEFLECCVELYFSVVRTYLAMKATTEHNIAEIIESPLLASETDDFWHTEPTSQRSFNQNRYSTTSSRLLLEIDDAGYVVDPGSAGATAVLDLISEALSYSLTHQTNSIQILETVLESVPLNFDSETVLTFKSLCLHRVMNYLERRLLNNDQKESQLLDYDNLWTNLGSLCSLIVDCVYIGVFPQPTSVIRVLEFCLSMLHSAKKDGSSEESSLPWTTTLLSLFKGIQPVDLIVKSTNRMILYCFLPSFLAVIGEDGLISSSGFINEVELLSSTREETTRYDICVVLELLHAHKEIIFHSSNVDVDLYCSLCIYLIALFNDQRKDARNAAIGIMKYLLTHCKSPLEEIFISKPNQNQEDNLIHLDVLNGGFDKLLIESESTFMVWFQNYEHEIKHVMKRFAGVKWSKYIEESTKLPMERMSLLEENRTLRLGKKVEDASKLDMECWEEYVARRMSLEGARVGVCSELENARRVKDESGESAEDEWRAYCQQLGHDHKLDNVSTMAWEDYWPLY